MERIEIRTPFITLGQFLKLTGLIDQGSMAREFLANVQVLINDELDQRRGRKLYPNDVIIVQGQEFKIEVANE